MLDFLNNNKIYENILIKEIQNIIIIVVLKHIYKAATAK